MDVPFPPRQPDISAVSHFDQAEQVSFVSIREVRPVLHTNEYNDMVRREIQSQPMGTTAVGILEVQQ